MQNNSFSIKLALLVRHFTLIFGNKVSLIFSSYLVKNSAFCADKN